MPPIAVSARVFGDVRVKLEVDRATGAVPRAAIVQGLPLLNDATLAAVRQWRFKPWSTPPDPFDVTLRSTELPQPVAATGATGATGAWHRDPTTPVVGIPAKDSHWRPTP
jgi:hypothetical protein